MRPIDFLVMGAYFAVVLAIGAHFARRRGDAADYFLGRHELPWWAVMLSIVATETSVLTFISVPGIAARGDLTFLQLPLGYLLGRVAVAAWLVPRYFTGEQETAYARLESRFGTETRRTASAIFMIIRALADSVRVFAAAIPLSIVTGWPIPVSVLVVAAVTLAYTWAGGLRAVVWLDVLQLFVYVLGGLAAIAVAAELAGGWSAVFDTAAASGKTRTFVWTLSFSEQYSFLGGLIGGALLSTASHGTDHLIVQRLLSTRSVRDAQRALIGSGVLVLIQFAIFLLVGTFIWAAGADTGTIPSDQIFPRFIVDSLPAGLSGLVVAGLLAAAMSTVSSSLNSLASATTHDFYAPLTRRRDPLHLVSVGRWATIGWAIVLAGGAMLFGSYDQPVVVLALSIASIAYGGLLGTYLLADLFRFTRQIDAISGIVVATAFMVVVVLVKPGPFAELAWPWYVPIGTATAVLAGLTSAGARGARRVGGTA